MLWLSSTAQKLSVHLKQDATYSKQPDLDSKSRPDNYSDIFQITDVLNGEYIVAEYQNKAVYVRHDAIEATAKFDNFWEKYFVKRALKKEQDAYNQKGKIYFDKYGKHFGGAVYAKIVIKGMNSDMVRDAIGPPTRAEHTVTDYGTSDIWIYPYDNSRDKYIFFTNGIVTGWNEPTK